MNIDVEIRKHFPYPTFNPGQFEAIKAIVEAFESGERFVVAQIPTGVGKSSIAITAHRVLRTIHGNSFRTSVATVTKSLQDQYLTEFPEIVDLRSKANYPCVINAGVYGSAECKTALRAQACSTGRCPYIKQRSEWVESGLRTTNAAFIIESGIEEPFNKSDLMVIDECHTLESNLVDHASVEFSMTEFRSLQRVFEHIVFDFLEFLKTVEIFKDETDIEVISPDNALPVFTAAIKLSNKLTGLIAQYETSENEGIQAALDEITSFSERLKPMIERGGEWILTEFISGKKIKLQPVYASQVSQARIFSKADRFLLMSATICGEREFARSLGIRKFRFIDIDNPIPVENRKVLATSLMRLAGGEFDEGHLTKMIDRLIDRESGSGVIHTVSYKLAKAILENSNHAPRMILHENLENTLEWLSVPGNVVVSPALEKGYDFKGDLARWQIIAKFPYDYLGDPWIRLNADRCSDWYKRRAILRVVQAAGRAVRGITDWATTYVIDSEFENSVNQNPHLYPDWFKDAVVYRNEIPFLRKR